MSKSKHINCVLFNSIPLSVFDCRVLYLYACTHLLFKTNELFQDNFANYFLASISSSAYRCHRPCCSINSACDGSSHGGRWHSTLATSCHRTEPCRGWWRTSSMTCSNCLLETGIVLKFLQRLNVYTVYSWSHCGWQKLDLVRNRAYFSI